MFRVIEQEGETFTVLTVSEEKETAIQRAEQEVRLGADRVLVVHVESGLLVHDVARGAGIRSRKGGDLPLGSVRVSDLGAANHAS